MALAIAASASKTTAQTDALEPHMPSGLCWTSPERLGEASAFISNVYHLHHNASICNPYQRLLSLRDDHGVLVATTGLRRADEGPLMVEHYLEAPVETVLATRGLCDLAPPRHRIMEVGALASATPGAGRRLMLSLVVVLERLGIEWLVVTASRTCATDSPGLASRCKPSVAPIATAWTILWTGDGITRGTPGSW